MADRTGQQFGNYRLIRLLGRGGFADVYLGEHIHMGSHAAIKVLHAPLIATDSQNFMQEARVLVGLDHPHIVRVLDCGIQDDIPFLVMGYAPHGTLRQRHPRQTIVPLAAVIGYVAQIAAALQYAHGRRLVHRDVKPENMLIGQNGEILVSDFGIAVISSTSSVQHTKTSAGTAIYMAPEQMLGRPQAASDQYALAVVVYEWLCGDAPFHGGYLELTAQHLHALPPPLRAKNPDVPPTVEGIVLKALTKAPGQRFVSIQDFAEALSNYSHFQLPVTDTGYAEPSQSFMLASPSQSSGFTHVVRPEELTRTRTPPEFHSSPSPETPVTSEGAATTARPAEETIRKTRIIPSDTTTPPTLPAPTARQLPEGSPLQELPTRFLPVAPTAADAGPAIVQLPRRRIARVIVPALAALLLIVSSAVAYFYYASSGNAGNATSSSLSQTQTAITSLTANATATMGARSRGTAQAQRTQTAQAHGTRTAVAGTATASTATASALAACITSPSPSFLSFASSVGSSPSPQSTTFSNCGGTTGTWNARTDSSGWLSIDPASAPLDSGGTASLTASVQSDSLSSGTYTGTIAITMTSSGGQSQSVTVNVTLTVTSPSATPTPTSTPMPSPTPTPTPTPTVPVTPTPGPSPTPTATFSS